MKHKKKFRIYYLIIFFHFEFSLPGRWNVRKGLEAAKEKLRLLLMIEDDILTSLPSSYLEVYEMLRIAQVSYALIICFHFLVLPSKQLF